MHSTAYFPFHFLFHHDFWDIYFIWEQTGEWMTSSDYTFIWLLIVMSTKRSWKPRNVFTRNYTFLDAIKLHNRFLRWWFYPLYLPPNCVTFYFISNQIKTFQVQQDREQRHARLGCLRLTMTSLPSLISLTNLVSLPSHFWTWTSLSPSMVTMDWKTGRFRTSQMLPAVGLFTVNFCHQTTNWNKGTQSLVSTAFGKEPFLT